QHLKNLAPDLPVTQLSLVKDLPGGGFSFRNLTFLLQDLRAGLVSNFIKDLLFLWKRRREFTLVVAVGDMVPVLFARLVNAPCIFVGVNKSSYYQYYGFGYTTVEKWLIKRWDQKVYVRDTATLETLQNFGIPATFAGNPLMDCIDFSQKLELSPIQTYITLLPGSHGDAEQNFLDLAEVAKATTGQNPQLDLKFLIPVPKKIYAKILPLVEKLKAQRQLTQPYKGSAENSNLQNQFPYNLRLLSGYFGFCLEVAKVVVGLTGTANEQAAGLGKPVVAFSGRGSQYTVKFARAQKQLLGEALLLTTKEKAADEITKLLNHAALRQKMGAEGQMRMVKSAACEKIAQAILQQAQ
ncbi:MAG: lipid-A-disaccharide synthase-related protein, partial [Candidatus Margulisiibacteriota bacterium]